MMKCKIAILTLWAAVATAAAGQEALYSPDGKASQVVADFYRALNLGALQVDSLLYIESRIVPRGQTDTLVMQRWAGPRQRQRMELWYDGVLQQCLFTDGKTYYECYHIGEGWKSVNAESFYDEALGYDFRGPLYQWYLHGNELRYEGSVLFEGQPAERIGVRNPTRYDRRYYFERDSKLLFLYTESDSIGGEPVPVAPRNRVDWHAYHEYQPLGAMLLPSVESYQHNGSVTFIFHRAQYVAPDEKLFTQRKRK